MRSPPRAKEPRAKVDDGCCRYCKKPGHSLEECQLRAKVNARKGEPQKTRADSSGGRSRPGASSSASASRGAAVKTPDPPPSPLRMQAKPVSPRVATPAWPAAATPTSRGTTRPATSPSTPAWGKPAADSVQSPQHMCPPPISLANIQRTTAAGAHSRCPHVHQTSMKNSMVQLKRKRQQQKVDGDPLCCEICGQTNQVIPHSPPSAPCRSQLARPSPRLPAFRCRNFFADFCRTTTGCLPAVAVPVLQQVPLPTRRQRPRAVALPGQRPLPPPAELRGLRRDVHDVREVSLPAGDVPHQ
jgi:hypothetical protein